MTFMLLAKIKASIAQSIVRVIKKNGEMNLNIQLPCLRFHVNEEN